MKPWLAIFATGLLLELVPVAAARGGDAPAATPRRGGILHLANPSDIRSLDPAIAFDSFTIPLVHLMFRGLLDYDDGTGLVLDQAKDWSISPDGKTYTFHLRPGVRFANGREVEPEDYMCAFERILSPQLSSAGQTYFLNIAGAREFVDGKAPHVSGLRTPDKSTLVIELKEPQYTFRYVLAMTFACPVPRELVQRYGRDFSSHLAGSGPYHLAEWRRGLSVRLDRNPYYQGPDGFVDGLDLMIGCDDTVMTMMLERGEIDQVPLASPAQAARFKRDPRLRSWLKLVDAAETDYFFMNTEMKPFDDARVRQAVNFAINRERLLKLAGGFATVADGIVPPAIPWHNPDLPRYDFNPDRAQALLREAGYPSGFKTELWYSGDQPIFSRLAEGVQQDLRQVGIQVELRPANFTAFDAKVTTRHQAPCGIWGWFQDYPDPSDFLDVMLNGERITDVECNNTAFYNNPEVNRCLDAAARSLDPAERTRLFRQAETLIMQDAPWAPLIYEQIPVLYNPRVHGTEPHPVWLWRYERMWLDPPG